MNAQTLISTLMTCNSTTTSQKQNATNVLNGLIELRKRTGWSFMMHQAIKQQRKLVNSLDNLQTQ